MAQPKKKKLLIPAPDLRTMKMKIEGLSPLMMHKWSTKALRQMEEAHAGSTKTTKIREARDPEQEFKDSMYKHPAGGYGFPGASFKLAAVSACRQIEGISMTEARSLFIVTNDLVKIKSPKPKMDSRPVRVSNGKADLRYRGVFWPWSTELTIRYNHGAITPEQIGHLLVLAGECVGIGELRPEKGDKYGRFTLAS